MGKLREYDCYYTEILDRDPDGIRNACWSSTRGKKAGTIIKIGNFSEFFKEKYIQKLVDLISKITPCELKKDGDKKYIYYTLIGGYTKDLYILNFIRYLWYSDTNFDNKKFFKILIGEDESAKDLTDPLEILSFASIKAMKENTYYTGDHSGLYSKRILNSESNYEITTKVRSHKEFNNWDGMTSMSHFAKGAENY